MTTQKTGNIFRKFLRPLSSGGFLALFFFGVSLCHAEPTVTARLSATDISLDGQTTLIVEIQGTQNIDGDPTITAPGLVVQGAGRTQSFQWINGVTSALITYQYMISPTQAGTYPIPAITIRVDGKTYQAAPLSLQVRSGGKAAGTQNDKNKTFKEPIETSPDTTPDKPIFLVAALDRATAFVGQQILLRIQFFHQPGVSFASQPRYSEPSMTGFLVEPLKQQDFTTTINGTPFNVTELRYALFPATEGRATIGSAKLDVALNVQADPFDPNNIFQSFFARPRVANLTSKPVSVTAKALPGNKPLNFGGAVGRFKITARTDATSLEVGKPFNLLVSIDGTGNIKALKEPLWPELKSFKRYETLTTVKINTEGKYVYGSKEFKILLIPQVSGILTIPPLTISYFDADEGAYATDTTNAISLQVKPGSNLSGEPDAPSLAGATPPTQEGVRLLETDIRFIKTGTLRPLSTPPYAKPSFYFLCSLPILFYLGSLGTFLHQRRRIALAGVYKAKGAYKSALRELSKSERLIKSPNTVAFYSHLSNALTLFIANKLHISAQGLIWDEVQTKLYETGVGVETRDHLRSLVDEADMVRFGTVNFSEEEKRQSLQRAKDVLQKLNKLFG